MQIQLTNRQSDQFRVLVEDNNERLTNRFANMAKESEEQMLRKLNTW